MTLFPIIRPIHPNQNTSSLPKSHTPGTRPNTRHVHLHPGLALPALQHMEHLHRPIGVELSYPKELGDPQEILRGWLEHIQSIPLAMHWTCHTSHGQTCADSMVQGTSNQLLRLVIQPKEDGTWMRYKALQDNNKHWLQPLLADPSLQAIPSHPSSHLEPPYFPQFHRWMLLKPNRDTLQHLSQLDYGMLLQSQAFSLKRCQGITTFPNYLHHLKILDPVLAAHVQQIIGKQLTASLCANNASMHEGQLSLGSIRYDMEQLMANLSLMQALSRCLRPDGTCKQMGMLLLALMAMTPKQQAQCSRMVHRILPSQAPQSVAIHLLFILRNGCVHDSPARFAQKAQHIYQLARLTDNPLSPELQQWLAHTPIQQSQSLIQHLQQAQLQPCPSYLLYSTLKMMQHYSGPGPFLRYFTLNLQASNRIEQQTLLTIFQQRHEAGQDIIDFNRQVHTLRLYARHQLSLTTILQLADQHPHAPIARIIKGLAGCLQDEPSLSFAITLLADGQLPIEKICHNIRYFLQQCQFQAATSEAVITLAHRFPAWPFPTSHAMLEKQNLNEYEQLHLLYRMAESAHLAAIELESCRAALDEQSREEK